MKKQQKRNLTGFLVLLLTLGFALNVAVLITPVFAESTTIWTCDYETGDWADYFDGYTYTNEAWFQVTAFAAKTGSYGGQYTDSTITYTYVDFDNQTSDEWLIFTASVRIDARTSGAYMPMLGFGFGAWWEQVVRAGVTYHNSTHCYGLGAYSERDDINDYYGDITYVNGTTPIAWADEWVDIELWFLESDDYSSSSAKVYVNDELIFEVDGLYSACYTGGTWYWSTTLLVGHLITGAGSGWNDWSIDDIEAVHFTYPSENWFYLYTDFFFGLIGVIMMLIAPSWLAYKVKSGGMGGADGAIERAFWAFLMFCIGFALCMGWLGGNFWG